MKAYLRLLVGVYPDPEQSAVSIQPSASCCPLPTIGNEQSVLYRRPPTRDWPLDKAFHLRPFLLLILVFVSCGAALAQESVVQATPAAKAETEITPLKIGDKIPDGLWDLPLQVVNHPEGKEFITLNDYRGKLIILDFWATWCSSSLVAFPNNNAIQEEYKDEIQILLVNTEINRDQKGISEFLKGYSDKHNTSLLRTSIVNDTELRKLIPFQLIPHYTWIHMDGTIAAATSSEGIDKRNISNILEGKKTLVNNKFDRLDFDPRSPFLFAHDFIKEGKLKFGSALSGPIEGLGRMSSGSIKIKDPVTRVFTINSSVLQMLLDAFQLEGRFNPNRIVMNVKDPYMYTYPDRDGIEEWKRSNAYSYELYIPAGSKEVVLQKMKEDILGHFGLEVTIEDRELECWVLTSNDEKLKGYTQLQLLKDDEKTSNIKSVESIANYLNYKLPIPVVNDSSYLGEFMFDLPVSLADTEQMLSALSEAGIYLKKDKRVFPVFVVSELGL